MLSISFILNDGKGDSTNSGYTMAYIAIGVVVVVIILFAFFGIVVWKKKQNTKETTISNQGIYLVISKTIQVLLGYINFHIFFTNYTGN